MTVATRRLQRTNPVPTDEHLLDAHDVAELLRVHPLTVYRYVKQNHLRAVRLGSVLRFSREDIGEFLIARETFSRS